MFKKIVFITILSLSIITMAKAKSGADKRNITSNPLATISGCNILPTNNIWNTPIDTLPVDTNSTLYINTIGANTSLHADFGSGLWEGGPIGIPYTTVPGTQAKVNVSFLYDDESDPGPYPIPANAPIEGGDASDGDRHVLVIDRDNCILYELYRAFLQPDGSWEADSGAIYDLKSNALRPAGWTSADAAGLPILPGLVRYDEVASGEINHALRFTVPQTRRAYVWPARHYASSLTGTQYPPMGQRFRLKAGFNISGYSPQIQTILKAFKKYGIILADNGSSWYISGIPDERWNNDMLHQLDNVKGSDFEAVDVSSLMINPNSGAALQEETTNTITVTSPNGGENWTAGTTHSITWSTTGTVNNVIIEYTINNGANWATIVSDTTNDGTFLWTIPATPSSQCKVRISESDGNPTDSSNALFSITTAATSKITVTSPNGGETWQAGSSHPITWTTSGTIGNLKIEYTSNNGNSWKTIASSTTNDGTYTWTVPNITSSTCKVRISETDGSPADTSNATFSILQIVQEPVIAVNRTYLNFGAIASSGIKTGAQTLLINNSGTGTLNWTITDNANWLTVTPTSGSNAGVVIVSINSNGLSSKTYTGTITISAQDALNSPQTVSVNLTVKNAVQDQLPFGSFETPINNSNVKSSIPVTGWALDDIEVSSVKIYRGQGNQLIFIGDAVFVEGARPDVEITYQDYPKNYKAGWGYMMLTNFLPNNGNGTYTLYAKATDNNGHEVTLGSKTIICSNQNAVKPFGALDTPTQGGTASGGSYINWGWVLTPQPNSIPTNGNTINVYIDGVNQGHPKYNIYRADIATLFPGYANTNGAAGYFSIDTTQYTNGVHTIQWTATDSDGNTDGIGSRYFTVQNTSTDQQANIANLYSTDSASIPNEYYSPILLIKGYNTNTQPQFVYPNEDGIIKIQLEEMKPIEIHLDEHSNQLQSTTLIPREQSNIDINIERTWRGNQIIGDRADILPVGSTLNSQKGIFYWQPGPGTRGEFKLCFTAQSPTGSCTKRLISIFIK